ncbi:UbiA family prenyltransferase [Knoellia sp. Soil729]|uniref:UbiA family prenyltransferase n=1 Tax=Knoellia sp. Soil729 TaxID=1736394 RepID=UPI0007022F83|nr:UbiA family prenyltransferase [Knoellia sp. Soil729]KRE40196.1 hypothetical protein ASG74_16235 [Knoellia sp. Soil729]
MSDRDIDAEFDAIIAHWDDDAPAPPRPRTVQDITAAYAALSPPGTDSPEPVVEDHPAEPEPGTPASEAPVPEAPVPEAAAPEATPQREASEPVSAAEPEVWREGPSIDAEDEEHFEPGPVQLPPGEDLGYWGAILGLVGGPLLMVWVALTGPFYRGWWILGSIVLFLGGFALLVMRQPHDRDPYDDDGARV